MWFQLAPIYPPRCKYCSKLVLSRTRARRASMPCPEKIHDTHRNKLAIIYPIYPCMYSTCFLRSIWCNELHIQQVKICKGRWILGMHPSRWSISSNSVKILSSPISRAFCLMSNILAVWDSIPLILRSRKSQMFCLQHWSCDVGLCSGKVSDKNVPAFFLLVQLEFCKLLGTNRIFSCCQSNHVRPSTKCPDGSLKKTAYHGPMAYLNNLIQPPPPSLPPLLLSFALATLPIHLLGPQTCHGSFHFCHLLLQFTLFLLSASKYAKISITFNNIMPWPPKIQWACKFRRRCQYDHLKK